jgi:TRAP-type C4-dicarboxylate transport system substrate-binding protein
VSESVEHQRRLWDESSDVALEKMRSAGLEIIIPDKEPFREAVKPMYEGLRGTEIGSLAEAIRQMGGDR